MSITVATFLVRALYVYCAVGLAFATWFAARGVDRLDPVAADGTRGFRLLILPGATALWPLLLVRCLRRSAA